MKFHKTLAKYYRKWYDDCLKSVEYCREHGDIIRASQYLDNAEKYRLIIVENWDDIEFFSVGDRAFIKDEALPKEFRGRV